jgi:hypothetical protein
MKKVMKPKVDESKLIHNPFANDLFIPVRSFKTKAEYLSAQEVKDGIVSKIHKIEEENVLEQESFTKVYNRSVFRLDVFSRTEKARSLFLWLLYEIDSGKDFIWINQERYMLEATVSINTFKEALKELSLNRVVIPVGIGYPNYYWINPTYFFSGSRINKYPNCLQLK